MESGDLISRQAVLSKIKTVCFSKEWSEFRLNYGSNGTRDYIINYIKELPSVQSEQRTGKWEYLCHQNMKCSECGYVIAEEDIVEFHYCPNCGAKMEEGE